MAKQNKKTILWIVLGIAVALLLFGVGTTVSNLLPNTGPLTPSPGTVSQTVPTTTGLQTSQPSADASTGTGMIRYRLYDSAGNLIQQSVYARGALVDGSLINAQFIQFDMVIVNTGTVSLDMTSELYGEAAFRDGFSGKPGCASATTARGSVIRCDLGDLASGSTMTLTSNLVDIDALVAARGSGNFVLNAYALAEFVHFGDAKTLEDSESLTLAIVPTPAPTAGFTINVVTG